MPVKHRLALAAVLITLSGTGAHAQSLDAVSAEAARSFDAEVRRFGRACPGEEIVVRVEPAPLNPGLVARVVSLGAGLCFGQPGQNAYLVVKGPRGWEKALSAEPGFIEVLGTKRRGYADLVLASLGMCRFTYRWNGSGYVPAGSEGCGSMSRPPTIASLSRVLRDRP